MRGFWRRKITPRFCDASKTGLGCHGDGALVSVVVGGAVVVGVKFGAAVVGAIGGRMEGVTTGGLIGGGELWAGGKVNLPPLVSEGVAEGDWVGGTLGTLVGDRVVALVGGGVGVLVGDSVVALVGDAVFRTVGTRVGAVVVGLVVGSTGGVGFVVLASQNPGALSLRAHIWSLINCS